MGQTLILPNETIIKNQVKLISATNRTQLLKPRFFKVDANNIAIEQGDIPDKMSWLGTPVFDTFIFNAFKYIDNKGISIVIAKSFMLDAVLIEVNQPKNIVKTSVAGRNGTVKEYVSDSDFEISITGMLVGRHANIPPDIVDKIQLTEILKAPVAVPISCNFLDMLNINSVVVTDYKFNQIEGTRNAIGVNISCVSDEPFEIKYNDAKVKSVPSFI